MACEVELEKLDGNVALFTLRNSINENSYDICDHLNNTIDNLEKDGYAKYIFDLQHLGIINSRFIGLIARRHYDLIKKGGRIAILKSQDMVGRSFEMSGLTDVLQFFSEKAEAVNSFKE